MATKHTMRQPKDHNREQEYNAWAASNANCGRRAAPLVEAPAANNGFALHVRVHVSNPAHNFVLLTSTFLSHVTTKTKGGKAKELLTV